MTTVTATTMRTRTDNAFGLLDPATYRRSLHLLLDLPLGLVTLTAGMTLLAVSAALAVTVVGIPLLIGTLMLARLLGRTERARARALLDIDVPGSPVPPNRGWLGRLADAPGWRAIGYSVLLGPVGLITGTLTLLGWGTALAAISFPAYAWALHDPALHIGGFTVAGVPAELASVACGLLLLTAVPATVRVLARLDAVLIRGLLY